LFLQNHEKHEVSTCFSCRVYEAQSQIYKEVLGSNTTYELKIQFIANFFKNQEIYKINNKNHPQQKGQ